VSELEEIYEDVQATYGPPLQMVSVAEEEIAAGQQRHPELADHIWHMGLKMLAPRDDLLIKAEFVYRAHCRELVERVAAGQDTRPGTTPECVVACSRASALAPLTTAGTGAYMRLWAEAFPDHPVMEEDQREHYEALRGDTIDHHIAELRRKLTDPGRVYPDPVTCSGQHNTAETGCSYAREAAA
jgi:hypothetical protein